jgi:hypothetical protein
MKQAIKTELYPIVLSLGMLSIYAVENKKPKEHKIYKLIKNLQSIVKLYKSKYNQLLEECFDRMDKLVNSEGIGIDTIAFTNALLVFHSQNKKYFNPNFKMINEFWMEYRKLNNDKKLDHFRNSRQLARDFFKDLNND